MNRIISLTLITSILSINTLFARDFLLGTLDAVGNVGKYISSVTDNNNNVYIVYYDMTVKVLKYIKWNGVILSSGVVDYAGDVEQNTSIVADLNNNIHMSFYDSLNRDLKYAKWDGIKWSTYTIDSSSNVGQNSSIEVDRQGYLYISYYDQTNGDLKYAYCNNIKWSTFTVDSSGDAGKFSSIRVNISNIPSIAYNSGSSNLRYAIMNSNTWYYYTVDSQVGTGQYPCLLFNDNNNPQIVYYDSFNQDLKFANYNGISWSTITINSSDNVGKNLSCIDTNLEIFLISYYDETNKNLKIAKGSDNTWTNITVDNNNGVGKYSSICLQNNNNPIIFYYDEVNGDLKYAKESYSISGSVKDKNNILLNNVNVYLTNTGLSTFTATGIFTLNNLDAGVYNITASKPGYSFTTLQNNLLYESISNINIYGTMSSNPPYSSGTQSFRVNEDLMKFKKIYTSSNSSSFPAAINLADVNGDGRVDLLAGFNSNVFLFDNNSLQPGADISTINAKAIFTGLDSFGEYIAVGDFNKDGKDDIVISAPDASGGGINRGEVYIYYGADYSGIVTTNSANTIIYGIADGDKIGCLPLILEDVVGDNNIDLIIGAPLSFGGGLQRGEAYIFYGPLQKGYLLASSANSIIKGQVNNENFGSRIVLNKVNNDNINDLLFGTDFPRVQYKSGTCIFFGGPTLSGTKTTAVADVVLSVATLDEKCSLPIASDFNNDGKIDLAVGFPLYSETNKIDIGRVCIFLSTSTFLKNTNINANNSNCIITGWAPYDYCGVGFTDKMIDINNDGKIDLILSVPGADADGVGRGGVSIFTNLDNYINYQTKGYWEGDRVYKGINDLNRLIFFKSCLINNNDIPDFVMISKDFSNISINPGEIYVLYDPYQKVINGDKVFLVKNNIFNPVNDKCLISFIVTDNMVGKITIKIFSVDRMLVKTILDENKIQGYYEISWDGKDDVGKIVGSGIYYAYIWGSNNFRQMKKICVLR
jgi:hypothetical protein